MQKMKKYIFPLILFIFLLFEWLNVFFGSTLKVISWWTVFFGSIPGLVLLIIILIIMLTKKIRHKRIQLPLLITAILALIMSFPFCWFLGICRIAYPAQIESVKPAISISLPLKTTTTVGWGGDSLENNYPHAIAPMERWAYDLLVEPYSVNSKNLADYGIYDAEVIAPSSGTIIKAHDTEEDLEPGLENYKTMMGNYIYIQLDETNTYLVLAHFKKNSILVEEGQHVEEGTVLGRVGNSGATSAPHLHIHHQRQNPATTSMFLCEGLPLYFRDINGPAMPIGGIKKDIISPKLKK